MIALNKAFGITTAVNCNTLAEDMVVSSYMPDSYFLIPIFAT